MTVNEQLLELEGRLGKLEKRLDLLDSVSTAVLELGRGVRQLESTLDTLMLQNQELDQRLAAFTAAVKGQKFTEPHN